ncbi:MAG: alpha/beta fold hydrolase [Patescibacteria group bacterium]|jgi:2-hydroxy-6-oxonona-2,4-dienedioate hydrolase
MQKIFLLHGWTQSKDTPQKWEPFIKLLRKRGIEPVLLKLPGLTTPLKEVWTLEDYVQWLKKALSKETTVTLLGHSFGGQICIRFTAKYPEKVKKLILLDSAGIRNNTPQAVIKRTVFLVLAKTGKAVFSNESLRKALYKVAREHDYEKASPILRKTFINVLNTDVTENLKHIHCPTTIIWGGQDRTTPTFMARKLHSAVVNSSLHYIANARHSPQFTCPEEVAEIVAKFVKSS